MPYGEEIESGLSPLGEIQRLQSGKPRSGFVFYGSGGNPVQNGLVSPSPKTKVSGAGATFETCQTVLNKLNYTMEQICERGSPIVVVLAGSVLPNKYKDPALGLSEEQAMYMGVYQVTWCVQEEPLEVADLISMIAHYQPYYPDLDERQLRFHLECRKKFKLVPSDDYPQRPGGYRELEVDQRDDRKPLLEVPFGGSYTKVLALKHPFSERQLFQDWVKGKGYLELADHPYSLVDSDKSPLQERHFWKTDLKESQGRRQMTVFAPLQQTFLDHWKILLSCSVAAFARMLKVNVDTDDKIGPLIDEDEEYHTGLSELTNYKKYVGGQQHVTVFLSLLGTEVMKSPTTHPIRTYDPKVLLLMNANSGGLKRKIRSGLSYLGDNRIAASEMIFNCIMVEIVKVQVLLEWDRLNSPVDSPAVQLPMLSDIPEFIRFVVDILQSTRTGNTNMITHDQYNLNNSFGDLDSFKQFLLYLSQNLHAWTSTLID